MVLHFKNTFGGNPNIYVWDCDARMQWPGNAMEDEGDGWFKYTLENTSSCSIIFNCGNEKTENLSRNEPGEYRFDGQWI